MASMRSSGLRLQPGVLLTQFLPIHGVKHLDNHQCGQSHGGWLVVLEDVAVEALEPLVLDQALRVMGLNGDRQP